MTVLPEGVLRDAEPLDAPWDCVDKDASQQVKLQVRAIDEAIFALRQSSRVSPEAPIGYLLCGTERALLLDTGDAKEAAQCPIRATVDVLLDEWSESHGVARLPLVVAHTHGHNDHTEGDAQFAGRPDTTIVAKDVEAVHRFFGLTETVGTTTTFDLGERTLLIAPTPGHDARSITTIDPAAGLMFSGDTAYPGRLYVDDLPAAKLSLAAMVDLAETHDIHTVLGAHVENDRHGRDYPVLTRFHRDEAPFTLTTAQLRALRDDVQRADGNGVHTGDPMTLYVGKAYWPMLKLLARGVAWRLTGRG
ncbi:MBL fold metallo-hydrolase [Flexivirga alba]|uniref:MBL fold metallo-hydrolase n=1 Tax=Flexivirga alba TaxID=702742 RepID=A0ABW2AHM2_9MICO